MYLFFKHVLFWQFSFLTLSNPKFSSCDFYFGMFGIMWRGDYHHQEQRIMVILKFSNSFVFFSSYFTNWWLTDIQTSTRSTSMHRPPYEGRYIAHFNNQAFWYILDLIIIPPEKSNIMLCTKIILNLWPRTKTYDCKWLMLANNILRRIVFLMIFAIEACYE